MTRKANARLAGVTFLVYIAAGIGVLASAGHAKELLALLSSFCALTLGVTLYAITRDQDPELALLALGCRFIEAIPHHEGGAIFFAVGSTIFAWLLLRGRMIPVALAWLGVVASAFVAAVLVLQRSGLFAAGASWSSRITWFMWLPLLVFEIVLATWFLIKGVLPAASR